MTLIEVSRFLPMGEPVTDADFEQARSEAARHAQVAAEVSGADAIVINGGCEVLAVVQWSVDGPPFPVTRLDRTARC